MIAFRDDHDVNVDQLEALFVAVGWNRPRPPGLVRRLVTGSRWVVSAWDGERLVGFARAISDGVSNAYISSVAVLPPYQRRGIGRAMIGRLLEGRPDVKFVLHASEAGEGLYRGFGFVDAERMMLRDRR